MSVLGAICPTPITGFDHVVLGHGSGGRLSAELLERVVLPALGGDDASAPERARRAAALEDQAIVALPDAGGARLAITTDAFVVRPLFFPGGDLGTLAVHGTVNDLAVGGATPRWLAASFVVEEGLPLEVLARIARSMRRACDAAGVEIVTGDTKVVERGKGDGLFVTTTGIGLVPPGVSLSVTRARPGDRVIVSGTLGDHGVAILAARGDLALETELESDTAPLTALCRAVLEACPETRFMRDPTRGGLASTLCELARGSAVGIVIDEAQVPLRAEVRGACELLGLDPLYVANEGKLVAVVPAGAERAVVAALRAHPLGGRAACIGEVVRDERRLVVARSQVGGERLVEMLSGEQLPRIC